MTTTKQSQANRQNALLSTGPRSRAGKARASRNALRLGVYSDVPVLPGQEREEDWQAFRAGIFGSLAPAGTLEETLAGRVALCAWRLRRTARYETAMIASGLAAVEERLWAPALEGTRASLLRELEEDSGPVPPESAMRKVLRQLEEKRGSVENGEGTRRLFEGLSGMADNDAVDGSDAYGVFQDLFDAVCDYEARIPEVEDERFLAGLGVPNEELADAYAWEGWTAGMIRKGAARLAGHARIEEKALLTRAMAQRQHLQAEGKAKLRDLKRQEKELRRLVEAKEERLKRE